MIKIKFGSIIWILVFAQILYTFFAMGGFILFRSHLQLWIHPDYSWYQKLGEMLGPEYVLSQGLASLPLEANYLVISSDSLWFLNYYLFPRKLFWYAGVEKDEDFKKIPKEWLRNKKIGYVLFYHFSSVRVIKLTEGEVK